MEFKNYRKAFYFKKQKAILRILKSQDVQKKDTKNTKNGYRENIAQLQVDL